MAKHTITVILDGEAGPEFEPDLPLVEGGRMAEALRSEMAEGIARWIGEHYSDEVFEGTITLTWARDDGLLVEVGT